MGGSSFHALFTSPLFFLLEVTPSSVLVCTFLEIIATPPSSMFVGVPETSIIVRGLEKEPLYAS